MLESWTSSVVQNKNHTRLELWESHSKNKLRTKEPKGRLTDSRQRGYDGMFIWVKTDHRFQLWLFVPDEPEGSMQPLHQPGCFLSTCPKLTFKKYFSSKTALDSLEFTIFWRYFNFEWYWIQAKLTKIDHFFFPIFPYEIIRQTSQVIKMRDEDLISYIRIQTKSENYRGCRCLSRIFYHVKMTIEYITLSSVIKQEMGSIQFPDGTQSKESKLTLFMML